MDDDPLVARIVEFIEGVGIPVTFAAVPEGSFMPGVTVRDGGVVIDRERLDWPGDLLHDAGHIAVTDPALRPTLTEVSDAPAEEMATIAWSYAAACAIGLDPGIVFHAGGYRGGGGWIADAFASGGSIGVPMLEWFGMTKIGSRADDAGVAPFPTMQRWLR